MYRVSLGLILVVACLTSAGQHDMYRNCTVHGVRLRDIFDRDFLQTLEYEFDLDFWQHGYPGDSDALVMLTPYNRNTVLELLDAEDIAHYLHVADVVVELKKFDEQLRGWRQSKRGSLMPFEDYPRYKEVDVYLERIAEQHPDIVKLVNAGQSTEGRDIKYLKISTSNFTDASKPIYFMDAMIHAREWITTPVTLYSIHRLVENLQDQDRDLLDSIDWIILPMVNPDGYEFSHTTSRFWRRTRSFNANQHPTCSGVDANRNFDINFNTRGVSDNPCRDTFPGPEPFSEPETRIIRNIIHEHLGRMQLYLNIHSHGNYILYGYGNGSIPQNAVQLFHVGAAMGAAIDAVTPLISRFYRVGNSAHLLYPASGSANDYAQAVGVPLAYALELPGYGKAFQVPPQYIDIITAETWLGIATSARLARSYYTSYIQYWG